MAHSATWLAFLGITGAVTSMHAQGAGASAKATPELTVTVEYTQKPLALETLREIAVFPLTAAGPHSAGLDAS